MGNVVLVVRGLETSFAAQARILSCAQRSLLGRKNGNVSVLLALKAQAKVVSDNKMLAHWGVGRSCGSR